MALMVRPARTRGPSGWRPSPPSCSLRCHFWRRCWLASPLRLASSPRRLGLQEGRQVLVQPRPQLVAELLVLWCQGKIHGRKGIPTGRVL